MQSDTNRIVTVLWTWSRRVVHGNCRTNIYGDTARQVARRLVPMNAHLYPINAVFCRYFWHLYVLPARALNVGSIYQAGAARWLVSTHHISSR